MTTTLVVPQGYGLVILSAFSVCLLYSFMGYVAGSRRRKLFNEAFMTRHFGEEHKKATGNKIGSGGYPDMGNGKYSDKLSYGDWYNFNNAQRVHYNYLEQIPFVVPFILIAGLTTPYITAIIGGVYTFGRLIYAVGYTSSGPTARLPGAISNSLCAMALLFLAGHSSVKLALSV